MNPSQALYGYSRAQFNFIVAPEVRVEHHGCGDRVLVSVVDGENDEYRHANPVDLGQLPDLLDSLRRDKYDELRWFVGLAPRVVIFKLPGWDWNFVPDRNAPKQAPTFIYFVRGETTGLIKIGKADDPRARLAALQGASPDRLVLDGVIRGPWILEKLLHEHFDYCSSHGEWFHPSLELRMLIRDCSDPIDVADPPKRTLRQRIAADRAARESG